MKPFSAFRRAEKPASPSVFLMIGGGVFFSDEYVYKYNIIQYLTIYPPLTLHVKRRVKWRVKEPFLWEALTLRVSRGLREIMEGEAKKEVDFS